MEIIIIFPKNEKQQFLLKSLLEEMKIRFKIEKSDDKTLLSKNEYVAKIFSLKIGKVRFISYICCYKYVKIKH
jgi:hypothetical protein